MTTSTLSQVQAFIDQGRLEHAKAAFKKLPFDVISNEDDLKQFGMMALKLRHVHAAIQIFKKAIALFPANPVFFNNLGTALLEISDLDGARAAFLKTIELKPDYSLGRINLGNVLERTGQLEQAKNCYKQVLQKQPDWFMCHVRLALIAEREGAVAGLMFHAASAFELAPRSPEVLHVQSLAFFQKQDWQKSLFVIDEAIALAPQNPAFHYHKGVLLEHLGRFQKAYNAFEIANACDRPSIDVREKMIAEDQKLIAFFKTEGSFLQGQVPTHPCPGPLFVLGAPRSGTTLLAQMLGAHPAITNRGELDIFPKLYQRAIEILGVGDDMAKVARVLWIENNQALITELSRYLSVLTGTVVPQDSKIYFVDKGIQNVFYLPLILKLCPGAPLVFMTRDGREVAFSTFKQYFAEPFWFKHDPFDALIHWSHTTQIMQQVSRLFGPLCFNMRYEKLVADPLGELGRLLAFLGQPWDDRCLKYHERADSVDTASYAQVRQPVFRDSLNHCRNNYPDLFGRLSVAGAEALGAMGYGG